MILENNVKENKWIIRGKVYDLSIFIYNHPGGRQILELNKGRDCTELFMTYHILQKDIFQYMNHFYVRDATENEISTPYDWNDNEFKEMYADLKQRFLNYFYDKKNGSNISPKSSNVWLIMHIILILSAIYILIKYWLCGYWLGAVLLGILGFHISTNIMHLGTHYSIVENKYNILNNININLLISDIFGSYHCMTELWYWQHIIVHHPYTNMENRDVDVYFCCEYFRLHPLQKKVIAYKKWKWIIPILISVTTIGEMYILIMTKFNPNHSIKKILDKKLKIIDLLLYFPDNYRFYIFIAQVLILFIISPLIIIYHLGFLKGIIFYILPRSIQSILFWIFTQPSHASNKAFRNVNIKSKNFIIHQLLSCVDYSTDSEIWSHLSIGLSNQGLHHLAPAVHYTHFVKINKEILKPFCKKYGIKRNIYNTYWEALIQHFNHIIQLNK